MIEVVTPVTIIMTRSNYSLIRLLLLLLLCFYPSVFGSSTPSNSSPNSSLTYLNEDRMEKYGLLIRQHLDEYYFKTGLTFSKFEEDFHAKIFCKALKFASGHSSDFNEVIFDPKISLKVHCFLLEFFVKVFEHEIIESFATYSPFLTFYTTTLAAQLYEIFNVPPQTIQKFVFPMLKSLVNTGNFLNYSMLFPILRNHFTEDLTSQFYKIHTRQYFLRGGIKEEFENALELEVFKNGIEFLGLYSPRYEIYSLFELKNNRTIVFRKPEGFYYILLHPLRATVNPINNPLTWDVLNNIEKAPTFLSGYAEHFLFRLEVELIETNFVNFSTEYEFGVRKNIFESLIYNLNEFVIIRLKLVNVFRAWLLFISPPMDEENLQLVRLACYESDNPEFRQLFDKFLSK